MSETERKTMNRLTENEPIETRAISVRDNGGAIGQALGVAEIVAQVKLIQDVMRTVMKEGEHYGTVPGCGPKKTLLQPGAQKLTMTFRLAPEYRIEETDLQRGHKEYRIICTLKSIQSGTFVGQGVGCCSSMESKYRWRGGARKCPQCGKETIIKGKAEYGGGWLCYQKKGGCGMKWADGAAEIEGQSVDKVENDNPADTFNTVLKMAKKRAFVDATITATAASDIFTQDIGDDEGDAESKSEPERQSSKPVVTPSQPIKPRLATATTKKWAIGELEGSFKSDLPRLLAEYLVTTGSILPSENIDDAPARFFPVTREQLAAMALKLKAFQDGLPAEAAFPPNEESTAKPAGATKATKDDEAWREVIVPVPRKGMKRDEYLKHPDTIGSLFDLRHGSDDESADARRRLFGFVSGYEPKGWEKQDGTKMPPNASDIKFRESLDQFADWFKRNHPDEKP